MTTPPEILERKDLLALREFIAEGGALTEQWVLRLVFNLLASRKDRGASERELVALIRWAVGSAVHDALLLLALRGEIAIADIKDGEPLLLHRATPLPFPTFKTTATDDTERPSEKKRTPKQRPKAKPADERDPAAVTLGAKGGAVGGPARAASLSPERRAEIAKQGAAARWEQPTEPRKGGAPPMITRQMVDDFLDVPIAAKLEKTP